MTKPLPIVDYIEIKAGDLFGVSTCVAVCTDGQRFTIPIIEATKEYPFGNLSKATLTLFGHRVRILDDGHPWDSSRYAAEPTPGASV